MDTLATEPGRVTTRRSWREIAVYGICCGVLIALLRWLGYVFLLPGNLESVYSALVAVIFATVGIALGWRLSHRKAPGATEVPGGTAIGALTPGGPFAVDGARLRESGITPRELEILGLIAAGLSNREIAGRLFVSENTVKTHSSRLFDKLGARRRTQAVQLGKTAGLIP
ncbi:MAG: response regulator transcription factor [Acidobacteriota bacterium]